MQSRLAEETLEGVERAYLPFVRGAYDQNLQAWQHKYAHLTGPSALQMRFPGPSAPCRIFLAGDRNAVADVRAAILRVYEEKVRPSPALALALHSTPLDSTPSVHLFLCARSLKSFSRIAAHAHAHVRVP